MRLLVTGAGRSGTRWLTFALRSCGISARHEVAYSIDRHGEGDWQCELSWLAAPYTPVDAWTVHMVRHPLAQIASRAAWGSFEPGPPVGRYDPRVKGRWAIDTCPEIAEGATPIERAAIHWVRWNEYVDGVHEILRLEDVTASEVSRLARLVNPDAHPPTLPPRNNQSQRPSHITWADVDHIDGLIELAVRFGYR